MKRLIVGLVSLTSVAHADEPSVDVSDLPPLPVAGDEASTSAMQLAASNVDEDVVVGAAKREQSLGNVASAVTVISADRIRRFGYRTVSEAISGVAGVYIQDTRLTQQVGIRGLQIPGGFNSRLLVLVDGASVNEAWGAFGGVGFDAMVSIDDIARIEVIRGPVSSLYGTNAFFGIINIVTRGAAEGSRAWGKVGIHSINGEVVTAGFAAGGVDDQLRGSVLAMNRIGESLAVSELGPMALEADGADTVLVALVGSYGRSFGQLRAFRSRRESPFAPYDADPALDAGFTLFNYQMLAEGGHTRQVGDKFTLGMRGYGTLYRYADEILSAPDDLFRDYGDAATIGAEVRGRYDVLDEGRLGVTTGIEANYNKTESRAFTEGDEANGVTIPVDFSTQGIYAELDSQITPWLAVTGGARFDNHSVVNEGQRLSPRAAVFLAKPEQVGVKLLYAEGFRNPSMFEGFFDDGRDFAANAAIKPEVIRSFEAVVWGKYQGLSARASAFLWDARDVIEQRPFEMTNLLQFQNVGRYITYGVEAEASYRNAQGWYGFGGVTVNRIGTEIAGELEYGVVVNAPKLIAAAGASTPKLLGYAHVSAELQIIGERETRPAADGTPSPNSPQWYGLNACVFVPNLRGFDVTVGGRNLIGERDLMPAPDDYDRFPDMNTTITVPRIPGEGRELYVKIGYSY